MAEAKTLGILGWLQAAGGFLQAWSLLEGGRAARIAGQRARAAAEFEAQYAEEQAGTALAIAQRRAAEERRAAALIASRSLAIAAASGAGVSDPTVVNLLAQTRGEGVYRANVALYEGEARARELKLEAGMRRLYGAEAEAEGARRKAGAALGAIGVLSRSYLSLYEKYGMKGPEKAREPERSPQPYDYSFDDPRFR